MGSQMLAPDLLLVLLVLLADLADLPHFALFFLLFDLALHLPPPVIMAGELMASAAKASRMLILFIVFGVG